MKTFDPKTAGPEDEGLFYDKHLLVSVILYWDDDEVRYEDGYLGCMTSFYDPDDMTAAQFGDGLWTGYESVADCLDGEWHTDGVVRLTDRGYDCETTAGLVKELADDGEDLFKLMDAAKRLLEKED